MNKKICKNSSRKAKPHNEVGLAGIVRKQKGCFFKKKCPGQNNDGERRIDLLFRGPTLIREERGN